MMTMMKVSAPRVEDDLIPTRASLLIRLKDWSDEASWKVFFDTYWKLIYSAAIRAGLSDAEAQDVVQETVIAVLKRLPSFQYDGQTGSFKGWLLKMTSWQVGTQFRRRRRSPTIAVEATDDPCEVAENDPIPPSEEILDPAGSSLETIWDEEWEKNLTDAALERVKRAVDPKQYQIFDLYVVKGWPAAKVAGTLQVNVGRVYLARHRVGAMIKQEIHRLRMKPI